MDLPVVRTVVDLSAGLIVLVETTWEEQAPVERGVEGPHMIDTLSLHPDAPEEAIPQVSSLLLQLVDTL